VSELNNLNKRIKILIILLALSLAGGSFYWGLVYSKTRMVPEKIVQTVTNNVTHFVEIEKPVVEVVEKFVEKKVIEKVPVIEYVEVEKEVTVELKQFESVNELSEWLRIDQTDELPYIKDLFECESFAQTLMTNTLNNGHYMSFQVLKNYTRPDTKEFIAGPHAINNTIIGNYIYFIDPQSDELWAAYVLEEETADSTASN
jgi:hypothetical protein